MDRIVVIGSTGLIGSHVAAALAAHGRTVTGLARHVDEAALRMPACSGWGSICRGPARPTGPLLEGTDAVVNCAVALQEGPADDVAGTPTAEAKKHAVVSA